jgi:hypothetical protein
MTTSGTASFNLDLNDIVEEAFERAGGELRTGYNLRTARRSLNLLFADWANRGVNMWTFEQNAITLVQGQPTYALPDDTVDLLDHVIRTNANQPSNQADLTITRISVSTYATIPNKLIQGRPIQIWVQRLTGGDSLLAGTVQSTINAAATSIPITSLAGVPFAGFVRIGTELIGYNQTQPAENGNPAYLLNCVRGQDGTTAASHSTSAAITLVQKQSVTVWPTPDSATTYQLVYWRMRRIQDAGSGGTKTMDVPFRFVPCLVAGLSYYIALKIPEGFQRLDILKAQYDEAWTLAAGEDQDKAAVRFVPRQYFIASGA